MTIIRMVLVFFIMCQTTTAVRVGRALQGTLYVMCVWRQVGSLVWLWGITTCVHVQGCNVELCSSMPLYLCDLSHCTGKLFVCEQTQSLPLCVPGHLHHARQQSPDISVSCRDLFNKQLSGSIPSSIGSMKQLTKLLVGARASVAMAKVVNVINGK